MSRTGEVNIDHQDFLIASGAFTEEDEREYQEWLDTAFEQTQSAEDAYWSRRAEEMEGEF